MSFNFKAKASAFFVILKELHLQELVVCGGVNFGAEVALSGIYASFISQGFLHAMVL
jgi:hypothetical protein